MNTVTWTLGVAAAIFWITSIVGWCKWGRERRRREVADSHLQAQVRQHRHDADWHAQHVDRLDRIYAAMYGYVPTDFDPPTEK